MYFGNYRLSKACVHHSLKSSFSEHPSTVKMLKGLNHLWNLHESIFSSLWGEIIWKITLLLEFEILGVFVDTLTADERCAVPECENLQFPIQMILSSTRNFFPQIFVRLMESTSNLKLFQKKKIVIANIFPKLQTVKDLLKPLSKKRHFRTSFNSQHVKG